MSKRTAIFGGSFNPPGRHHRAIAARLASMFDEVRVIPCGPRPDKPVTGSIPAVYRAALADLTFGPVPGVVVDLFDLEQATFTTNIRLQKRFGAESDVWHVVGADLVAGGAKGESQIQRTWERGEELWQSASFLVMTRPGHAIESGDLPPKSEVMEIEEPGSSTAIRDAVSRGEANAEMLATRAMAYIERYGLYRAPNPGTWARGTLSQSSYRLLCDDANPKAAGWKDRFPDGGSTDEADFFTVLGGDGAMLRNIRESWRERMPFFGVNAGHLGFLMNAPEEVFSHPFPPEDVIFRQLPMLYLEFEREDGTTVTDYAFNDAWVERSTSQSAWLQITVNGVTRIEKLVCDGGLVATAAGSTAYARSMGAQPLLADSNAWLLVGSNVMDPANWRSALLSPDATVEVRGLSTGSRPIEAYVDGLSQGPVVALRARVSRAAATELVYCASHDMAEKIAAIQFHDAPRK
jgi:NAD kinase